MRTRSEFSNHVSSVVTDIFPRTGTSNVQILSLGKDYERVTTDEVVPNFRARSANGEVFNNSFSSNAVWTSFTGAYHNETWTQVNGVWVQDQIRDYTLPWPTFPSWSNPFSPPNLAGSAGNKALAGVNSTSFNAPLFALEWSKTRALIPQIGELLVRNMKQGRRLMRNGKLVKYLQPTSKNLANAWLIERFGIVPLLYELQGACDLLTKIRPPRATSRGNESWSGETSSQYNIADSCGTWHVTKTSRLDVSFRNGILYEGGTSNYANFAKAGVTRPATVAWELVPWSFVIDRFVDISSWLDAIQPDGASKFLSAWSGRKDTLSITCTVTGFTPGSGYGTTQRNSSFNGSATRVSIVKYRNPWAPSASLPVWNPYFNIRHLADYAALVRQRIRLGT